MNMPATQHPPPSHPVAPAQPPSDAALRELAADRRISRKALAARLGMSERTLYRRLTSSSTTT
jgi:AraC-like DNA-binding protein